jgi:5-methylcytosine-specific restriction endonuclease McrA
MTRPSKAAATLAIRELIDRQHYDIPWSDANREELCRLTGSELAAVYRRRNLAFPSDTRHLHAIRPGESEPSQWSWRNALTLFYARDPESGELARRRNRDIKTLRTAIAEELRTARDLVGATACAVCGRADDLTVDHKEPPFISIAAAFLEERGPLRTREVQGAGACLEHEQFTEWLEFHASRATYQLLCRSCNSKKGART